MPIYEFHCEKCEKDSEILVASSKWKGTKCPHCGSTKLSKKLSVFAASGGGNSFSTPPCGDASAPCASGGGCCCGGGAHHHH